MACFGRFIYDDGSVSMQFLFGKSKVCPVSRSLTIPRLELVAASLTTRVACSVLQESNIKHERVIYMTDSSATLHLIRNNTLRFCVFVDSRLAEIRESSLIHNWRYCPTNLNPSDVGTCLIAPKNRKKFLPWVEGPEFLLSLDCEWPSLPIIGDEVEKTIFLFISIEDVKIENDV